MSEGKSDQNQLLGSKRVDEFVSHIVKNSRGLIM